MPKQRLKEILAKGGKIPKDLQLRLRQLRLRKLRVTTKAINQRCTTAAKRAKRVWWWSWRMKWGQNWAGLRCLWVMSSMSRARNLFNILLYTPENPELQSAAAELWAHGVMVRCSNSHTGDVTHLIPFTRNVIVSQKNPKPICAKHFQIFFVCLTLHPKKLSNPKKSNSVETLKSNFHNDFLHYWLFSFCIFKQGVLMKLISSKSGILSGNLCIIALIPKRQTVSKSSSMS